MCAMCVSFFGVCSHCSSSKPPESRNRSRPHCFQHSTSTDLSGQIVPESLDNSSKPQQQQAAHNKQPFSSFHAKHLQKKHDKHRVPQRVLTPQSVASQQLAPDQRRPEDDVPYPDAPDQEWRAHSESRNQIAVEDPSALQKEADVEVIITPRVETVIHRQRAPLAGTWIDVTPNVRTKHCDGLLELLPGTHRQKEHGLVLTPRASSILSERASLASAALADGIDPQKTAHPHANGREKNPVLEEREKLAAQARVVCEGSVDGQKGVLCEGEGRDAQQAFAAKFEMSFTSIMSMFDPRPRQVTPSKHAPVSARNQNQFPPAPTLLERTPALHSGDMRTMGTREAYNCEQIPREKSALANNEAKTNNEGTRDAGNGEKSLSKSVEHDASGMLCRVGVEPDSDQDDTSGDGVFKHIFDEKFDEIPLPKDPPPSILGGGVLQSANVSSRTSGQPRASAAKKIPARQSLSPFSKSIEERVEKISPGAHMETMMEAHADLGRNVFVTQVSASKRNRVAHIQPSISSDWDHAAADRKGESLLLDSACSEQEERPSKAGSMAELQLDRRITDIEQKPRQSHFIRHRTSETQGKAAMAVGMSEFEGQFKLPVHAHDHGTPPPYHAISPEMRMHVSRVKRALSVLVMKWHSNHDFRREMQCAWCRNPKLGVRTWRLECHIPRLRRRASKDTQ